MELKQVSNVKILNSNRSIDAENKLMVTKGQEDGGLGENICIKIVGNVTLSIIV